MNDSLLGPDAVRQVRQLVAEQLANGRPAPERQRLRRRPTFEATTGVAFVNDSGFEVPPHAVMEVVSIDNDGVYHITRPTGRREVIYLINRDTAVVDEGTGTGDWGLSEPVKVLCAGVVDTYEDDNDRNVWNRSFAPRAGYWHLRSDNGASVMSDENTEDFGFKKIATGGWSNSDYAYDFAADTSLTYAHGFYFVQQIESPEPSLEFPLQKTVYDSSWSDQTTLTSSYRYVKLYNDDIGQQFSRVGVKTVIPTTLDPYPIRFIRSGLYRVDLMLAFSFEGNAYADLFTSTATTSSSGHTHNYDKIKESALSPSRIQVAAQFNDNVELTYNSASGLGAPNTMGLLDEHFFYCNPYASGFYRTYRKFLSFQVQCVLNSVGDGYDPDNDFAGMRIGVKHTAQNGTVAAMDDNTASVATIAYDYPYMFIRITRVREKRYVQE